jgi:hypothetical protein
VTDPDLIRRLEEQPPDPIWDRIDPDRAHRDLDGNPISLRQWCVLFESTGRIVAQDHVGEYYLSTVWLGIDHGFGDGPPLIYETMLFKGTRNDVETYRYSTWTEAEQHHAKLLEELKLIVAGSWA